MTRDFNKQDRDDSRSSFRNNSSNRYGEERSPRPPRARLNRETVDRAWENGAPSLHADYRTRSSNGQPPRNNWRSNQNASPNAPGGNRTYGTRQNNYRDQDSERRPNNGYSNSRPSGGTSRPDGDRPRYNGQRSNGNGASSYRSDGPRYNGYQRSNSNDAAPYNRPSGPRSNGSQYRSGERRYDDNRPDSTSYRPNSRPGPRPAQSRGPQINKPEGERPRRGAGRYVHPEKEYRPRINELKPPREARPPHPRFLSRPEVRRERDAKRYEEYAEQFEGDYEQFDSNDGRRSAERSEQRPARNDYQPRGRNDRRNSSDQQRERHVTPLPDGRVLKGSRPAQRKNAEFWTNVNNDTEALIGQVQVNEAVGEEAPSEEGIQSDGEQPRVAKRAPRATKSSKAGGTETTKKPRSNGPKPSQKGYKWPTS